MLGSDHLKMLRTLLCLDFVFLVLTTAVLFVEPRLLPADLKTYANLLSGDKATDIVAFSTGAAVLAASAAAILGLWTCRRWARIIYTVCSVLLIAGDLIGGADVRSGLNAMLSDIGLLVTGAILVLIWAVMNAQFASSRQGYKPKTVASA